MSQEDTVKFTNFVETPTPSFPLYQRRSVRTCVKT